MIATSQSGTIGYGCDRPNMAGKSTFLRQNALIAILAQMGSYVPARRAHIGVVDRLFSRVGRPTIWRADARLSWLKWGNGGNSQPGNRKLTGYLDEIGRGTSTFDGLSIAWATVEHGMNQPVPGLVCHALP